MVMQVAGDSVPVGVAGGTGDGRLGTSAPLIASAIRGVFDSGAEDVFVLIDLGSAALSLEVALEDFSSDERAHIATSDAPLVEGAVIAAVQASVGATLREVQSAALGALDMAKLPTD
jgi:dihydroxyacetone kinase DhaKLM complex PTS-EIIA-like component DhaM